MLAGMTKMSPTSPIVISSSRSMPRSGLYESYRAEMRRTAWGPNRVPERYVVPMSNGAPTTATSNRPTSRMFSTYGDFRKVLMPANMGSSPRENNEMLRSLIDRAASRPRSRLRSTSSRRLTSGTSLRRRRARIPDSRLRSAAMSSSENLWSPVLFGLSGPFGRIGLRCWCLLLMIPPSCAPRTASPQVEYHNARG